MCVCIYIYIHTYIVVHIVLLQTSATVERRSPFAAQCVLWQIVPYTLHVPT